MLALTISVILQLDVIMFLLMFLLIAMTITLAPLRLAIQALVACTPTSLVTTMIIAHPTTVLAFLDVSSPS